jgi:hypothetical protein
MMKKKYKSSLRKELMRNPHYLHWNVHRHNSKHFLNCNFCNVLVVSK